MWGQSFKCNRGIKQLCPHTVTTLYGQYNKGHRMSYGSTVLDDNESISRFSDKYSYADEEGQPTLFMYEGTKINDPVHVCSHRIILASFIILVSTASLFSMLFEVSPSTNLSRAKSFFDQDISSDINKVSSTDITMTASNEYGRFSADYPWMNDIEGTQLLEPYKMTELTISGSYISLNDDINYVLVISGIDDDTYKYNEYFNEPKVFITLKEVGKYDVSLHVFGGDGYLATYNTRFICK
jgi:hypothetical protein